MPNLTDEELLEAALANQIPEAVESVPDTDTGNVPQNTTQQPAQDPPMQTESAPQVSDAAQYLGQKISHIPGKSPFADKEKDEEIINKHNLSRIGEKIGENMDIRDGWIDVDKRLLGKRAIFYPEDWNFRIRPATVEAIRNWSTIDDENPNSIDDVFNEILKSCLMITTSTGRMSWGNVNSWDRLFFILLIREYTFVQGESKLSYTDYCPECDNEITFELNSQSLMYDFPDDTVMKYYEPTERTWYINPEEFELDYPAINLYIPTLEREAAIKEWMIARVRENNNYKFDGAFLRFSPWLMKKVSKDDTIARKQIKEAEMRFKSWDRDMFSFMDDVLRNITVTPSQKLISTCPICGEEATSTIRFPGRIRDIFTLQNKYKKFGSK